MSERYQARGLRVVSVVPYDEAPDADERAKVAETAKEEKMTYPAFLDAGLTWTAPWKLNDIPSFMVIGRDGRKVADVHGSLKEGSDALAKVTAAVEQALAAPKG